MVENYFKPKLKVVAGRYRNIKNYVFFALVALYTCVPFVRFGDGTALFLFDLPNRKFQIFGITFWPQETYYLYMFLVASVLLLFFATSLFGRIWCGWGCPQYVYLEIFHKIGRLFQGKKYKKKGSPLFGKILTHFTWIVFSLGGGLIFIAYFVDVYSEILPVMLSLSLSAWLQTFWFKFMLLMGLLMYIDIGLIGEKWCVALCPYSRFQSVMLDKESMIIGYDKKRGEPRRAAGVGTESQGDCISCNLCWQVCPTGIDIRDGLQIGCIACALCIDACTKALQKSGKPTLIDYTNEALLLGGAKDPFPAKMRHILAWKRPRTIVYGALISLIVFVFAFLVMNRMPLLAALNPNKQILPINSNGIIRNYYELQIHNMSIEQREFSYMIMDASISNDTSQDSVLLPANGIYSSTVILSASQDIFKQKSQDFFTVKIKVYDKANPDIFYVTKAFFRNAFTGG